MASWVLIFSSLLLVDGDLDLNRLDLHQPELAAVWQWDEDLLFCETHPPKLVLVSKAGEIKAVHDREGQGPGELMFPRVMGFEDNLLYIINNRSQVVVFDKSLKVVKTLPSLHPIIGSKIVAQGAKIGGNRFVLFFGFSGTAHKFGIVEIQLDGKKWKVTNRYFPFNIQEENRGQPIPYAKNPMWQLSGSRLFRIRPLVLKDEDDYEIQFYSKPWNGDGNRKPIGGMFAIVDDIISKKDKSFRCFIEKIGTLDDGFVVEIIYEVTEKVAHDFFDFSGGFIRRDFGEYYILPIRNADRTLILDWSGKLETLRFLPSVKN